MRWLPQPESDRKPFENLDPQIPNPDYPNLDVARVKRMTREYLGSVKGVDRNVGRVIKLLDELKLAKDTIVVFTSDHGYSMGHNGIWHKGNGHWVLKPPPAVTNKNIPRNQRPNMYDNSIFVPTAVRWPEAHIAGNSAGPAGKQSRLVSHVAEARWHQAAEGRDYSRAGHQRDVTRRKN